MHEGAGAEVLPPYSPDSDPVEEASSKAKGALRRAKARTREALFEATTHALSPVTPEDARGFFAHSGYGTPRALPISRPL